ncbi:MAG: MFS transporter [bacterium]|nr:MFS transporter [bacterium]
MFDFANSAYTTLISTVAYSVYFRQAVVHADDNRGDFLWGVTQVAVHLILILSAPVFGALADYSGRKKRFLLLTTIQTVIACAALFFVTPGSVALGMALVIVGTVGFEGGYVFYNAFLPEVSTPKTIGRISGLSWGTGFIGGLLALTACGPLLALPLIRPGGALDPVAVQNRRWSFVIVALFFAIFSVPTFVFLRERGRRRSEISPLGYVKAGFVRVRETLSHLKQHRQAAKFVLAALFFSGGIDAVIKFSAIYANVTFQIEGMELYLLFCFTNIVAVPGTIFFGRLADRIGGRKALMLTLVLWCALLFLGALATHKIGFWIMAAGVASAMGSTQAVGRSFMAQLSPASRESEFFGFYVLCNKVGSILALLAFSVVSSTSGNQRWAVLSVLPFFLMGLVVLRGMADHTAASDG